MPFADPSAPLPMMDHNQSPPAPGRRPFSERPGDAEAFDEAVGQRDTAGLLPGPESLGSQTASTEVSDLVERAQGGDAEALDALFRRYYGLLVDVARRRLGARLRQKEDADDLAQTTFREATRDFQRYRYQGDGSLLRWLIQILHNKIRDRAEFYSAGKRDMRRERTIEAPEGNEEGVRMEPPSQELSVTRQVSREEEFAILREGLEELSPEHRTAITLVFFQGLSLRDAGERMGGRTEDAVRMLLRRAEARLGQIVRAKLDVSE